jgi:hypothetical protein
MMMMMTMTMMMMTMRRRRRRRRICEGTLALVRVQPCIHLFLLCTVHPLHPETVSG